MMRPDLFCHDDTVLLLGEGNFSFSVGLLSLGLQLKLTATCFESNLNEHQKRNSELLRARGVSVMSGIDATKVHENAILKSKKFDKIIFNFPHTGGKMKIHLNRELLRNFFMSASTILFGPGGSILVTLCSGQGADFNGKRTWSDSWQVVDMAGYACMMLMECSVFEWALFPGYSNVGYRSLQKGFNSKNAIVHKFCIRETSMDQHVGDVIDFYRQGINYSFVSRPFFVRKMKRDILQDNMSPPAFILEKLVNHANSKGKCQHHIADAPYTHALKDSDISLALLCGKNSDCKLFLFSCYILNKSTIDFSEIPVKIQTLFIGEENYDIFIEFVKMILQTFHMSHCSIIEESCYQDSKNIMKVFLQRLKEDDKYLIAECSSQNGATSPILFIYIDTLVKQLFSFNSWKQLWADNVQVSCENLLPVVYGLCPYPVSYTFDISFIVSKNFTENLLIDILWDIAGEILIDVQKVSEFLQDACLTKSMCYRLSYLSYDHSMCRKSVISFHHNGIGRALEIILGVTVK